MSGLAGGTMGGTRTPSPGPPMHPIFGFAPVSSGNMVLKIFGKMPLLLFWKSYAQIISITILTLSHFSCLHSETIPNPCVLPARRPASFLLHILLHGVEVA